MSDKPTLRQLIEESLAEQKRRRQRIEALRHDDLPAAQAIGKTVRQRDEQAREILQRLETAVRNALRQEAEYLSVWVMEVPPAVQPGEDASEQELYEHVLKLLRAQGVGDRLWIALIIGGWLPRRMLRLQLVGTPPRGSTLDAQAAGSG